MQNQHTAYSFLELALVSEGSTIKETLNNSLSVAKVAEESGYTRFWLAEHHNTPFLASCATSLLVGYIAENTTTLRIGSGGIMLPNHSPLVIAEQFGTLAHLYPGRIDLGLGRAPGTDGETAKAIRADFMQAAYSFPQEVAKLQQYISAENSNSKVRAAIAEGTDLPLYILGSSTDSAHLAAREGLPYAFASHFATSHLFDALDIYRSEFQPSGQLAESYTMAGINVFLADTQQEAEELFTTLVRSFANLLTGNRQPLQPPGPITDELRAIMQHPQIRQMLRCSFVGTRESVRQPLMDFIADTGVNELIAVSHIFSPEARLKSVRYFAQLMHSINAGK